MKKLILILMCMILLVGGVSAWNFDNTLSYEDNDMKVKFKNSFGLGKDLGTIELKSHKSLTEIKQVGFGKEEVVMYYDFTNWELYKNGLGEVVFTDMKTGEEIDKDYYFVEWKEIDVPNYIQSCDSFVSPNGTQEQRCSTIQQGTKPEYQWVKYDSSDIPARNVRIGLKTYVRKGDYIDGVWTIAGKKVKKHARWTADLNVGLLTYYKFDEQDTSGSGVIIDSVGNNNATNNGADNSTGILGTSYDYVYENDDYIISDANFSFSGTGEMAFSIWFKLSSSGSPENFILNLGEGSGTWLILTSRADNDVDITDSGDLDMNIASITDTDWHHVVYTRVGNVGRALFDGAGFFNGTISSNLASAEITIGALAGGGSVFMDGNIDELALWNRSLSWTEMQDLYNGGTGITYTDVFGPVVVLNKPDNNTNFTTNSISMNCTASDSVNLVNVSLLLDGVVNETNSSGINNSLYNFDKIVSIDEHNWTCRAANNKTGVTTADTRFFNINISVGTELISPVEAENFTTTTVNFTFNSTAINQDLVFGNLTVWHSNGTLLLTNSTSLSGSSEVQTLFSETINDGNYIWGASTTGEITSNTTSNRTFTVHTTPSTVIINFPTGNIESFVLGDNLTLNWTITEPGQNLSEHIVNCSYTYNSVETFLNLTQCIETNSTTFLYVNGVNNLSFKVQEEFGLNTTNTTSWTFSILENEVFFTESTIEGVVEEYTINITLGVGESISASNFSYDGSGNSVTIIDIGNNMFNLTSQLTVPSVITEVNLSFFWIINLASGEISTTSTNQTVQNLGIDNCSINNNTIFNYTMLDEEFQTQINNANFEIDLNIFNADKTSSVLNFSGSINNTNPVAICLSIDLTNDTIYTIDSTVKYSSLADYVIEYYNIQNFLLKNSTAPQEINLFELLAADSTDFQITFKDSNFVAVEDALIHINRQYVSEGVFKTVEIPKTDSNGQTIAHFVQNDVIYDLVVTKQGEVLGTFNNVIAFCEDATVGQCFIALNALSSNLPVFDYDAEVGLSFDFTYNETSRILLFPFTTTDGSVKNVSLNGIKLDMLGNSSICGDSLISASGTLTCIVPASVGNETIIIDIFVDGDLKIQNYISAGTEFDVGDAGYFLLFFLVLSCALMLSQSKIGVVVGTIIGFISGILLSFFKGGLVGVGSSIVWLVIWGVALIWKLNSERQT